MTYHIALKINADLAKVKAALAKQGATIGTYRKSIGILDVESKSKPTPVEGVSYIEEMREMHISPIVTGGAFL